MTRWQYRVKPMNLDWREEWHDVFPTLHWVGITYCDALQFRRRPGRLRLLVAAVLHRGRPS